MISSASCIKASPPTGLSPPSPPQHQPSLSTPGSSTATQHPPSSPARSTNPPSPHSKKCSRRECVQQYFRQYPPEAWSLGAFEVYCRQSEFDGWHASNINGFWLEFLTDYHYTGTAEERKKAAKLIANYRKRFKKPKRPPINVNARVSGNGTFVAINKGGVVTGGSGAGFEERAKGVSTPVEHHETGYQPIWPASHLPSTPLCFEDGSEVGSWLEKLPLSGHFPSLKVIDLDAHGFASFPEQRKELRALMPALPALPEVVRFTINRFEEAKDMASYITITESSPRPPNCPPAPENYVCTYVNTAVSHILTLIDTFTRAQCLHTHVKEGSLDIIWGSIIDNLYQGGTQPHLHLARKELNSFIPSNTHRFDGLFRYRDHSQAFDVGVAEATRAPSNFNNDSKGEYDLSKILDAMMGMLFILAERLYWDWEVVRKIQVFGFITSGWSLTIYRMSFCTTGSFLLRRSETFTLVFDLDRVRGVWRLLETLVRIKEAMCETVELVLRKSRGLSF